MAGPLTCGRATPEGLLPPAGHRCARSAARDPVPSVAGDPLPPAPQPEDGREGAGHRPDRRRAAGQPRGRHPGVREGERPRRVGRDRQGVGPPRHPAVDAGELARLAVGTRRPRRRRHRGRERARRDHGPEGRGPRGHPLRRSPARPARGQGRARAPDPRARHPRDGARRRQRRGDLRRLAAHAGPVARPGRPRRQPADEDHPGRGRSPGVPGAGRSRRRAARRSPPDVPAGPLALHDRPDGRRLRDLRGAAVLRAVRRHRRHDGVRGPVPQRLPPRLRRRLEPAPGPGGDRQAGVQPTGRGRRPRPQGDRGDGRRHRRGAPRREDGGRRLREAVQGRARPGRAARRPRPRAGLGLRVLAS